MGTEFSEEMKDRRKAVATQVLELAGLLRRGPARRAIMDQLIRSATSVGANYRSARRARSRKEFASKLGVALEEADETLYWLEIAVAAKLLDREAALPVWKNTNEVVRILVATVRSVRGAEGQAVVDDGRDPATEFMSP